MAENLVNKVLSREADRPAPPEQLLFLDTLLLKDEQAAWELERQEICKHFSLHANLLYHSAKKGRAESK